MKTINKKGSLRNQSVFFHFNNRNTLIQIIPNTEPLGRHHRTYSTAIIKYLWEWKYGILFGVSYFYFPDLQNEEDYERKESSSALWGVKQVSEAVACSGIGDGETTGMIRLFSSSFHWKSEDTQIKAFTPFGWCRKKDRLSFIDGI